MSLLDEARDLSAERSRPSMCAMAKAITEAEIDPAEARDLLRSTEVDAIVKFDTLTQAGMRSARSTVQQKILQGCRCRWCEDYGTGSVGVVTVRR